MKFNFILFLLLSTSFLSGCASHKGAIKPNPGLADFNKHGKAYYLSLDQIGLGDSKKDVVEAYGQDYENEFDDEGFEKWTFESYKAKFARDPVEKLVTVTFKGSIVVDKVEKYLQGPLSLQESSEDIPKKLREIKLLREEGILTESEYLNKKAGLLEKL